MIRPLVLYLKSSEWGEMCSYFSFNQNPSSSIRALTKTPNKDTTYLQFNIRVRRRTISHGYLRLFLPSQREVQLNTHETLVNCALLRPDNLPPSLLNFLLLIQKRPLLCISLPQHLHSIAI